MKSAKLSIWVRISAGLLTLMMLVVFYHLPEKRYSISSSETVSRSISCDSEYGGNSEGVLLKESPLATVLKVKAWPGGYPTCSINFIWGSSFSQGLDFSKYRGLRVKLNYEGPARILQLYVRNFDARYATNNDINSTMFAVVKMKSQHFNQPLEIELNEFRVADWWLDSMDITREMQRVRFNNVFNMGIAIQEHGEHRITVEKMELYGDWVSPEALMLTLIIAWMILVLWEGFSRLYEMQVRYRTYDKLITELVDKYSTLENKKNEFEQLSKRDELTGLLNRLGLKDAIVGNYLDAEANTRGGVVALLDIDHFKRMNDEHGHTVGDKVLIQFASILQNNIRSNDIVGRWGGEEFILICPNATIDSGLAIAEKIRDMVQHTRFPAGAKNLRITTSIGMALINDKNDFERALKHADEALYQAKSCGRNRIVSEFTAARKHPKTLPK